MIRLFTEQKWTRRSPSSGRLFDKARLRSFIMHPKPGHGPNARDYLYERDIIKRNYSCVMWGVWATCICFASFRLGANPRFQQYRSRLFSEWTTSGTGSTPSRTPKTTTTHTLSKEYKSPSDIQHEQLRDRLSQASSVPLDLFLSLLIGTSAATFLADFGQITNDFQNLPLVYGRSVVSDVLCQDMMGAYDQIRDDNVQTDDRLRVMRTFVMNCRKRSEMEAFLRQQAHLPNDTPVSIPFGSFNPSFMEFLAKQRKEQ
jgi:hypothetical protein